MAFRDGVVMCPKCGFTYWLSVGHDCKEDAEVTMEELCPFHDLGQEFADCTCPCERKNNEMDS